MPIKLPDFSDTRCMALGACGFLEVGEKEVPDAVQKLEDEVMIASYRNGKVTAYLRVLWGGISPKHVHIDVYRKEVFGKNLPQKTHTRKEIEKVLDNVVGKKVTAYVFGRYFLALDELPEEGLIRSTFFATRENELAIEMAGADFTIRGAPIRGLSWQLVERGTRVRIDVSTIAETVIGKNYLLEQLQLIDSGFRVFVLEDRADDTD